MMTCIRKLALAGLVVIVVLGAAAWAILDGALDEIGRKGESE